MSRLNPRRVRCVKVKDARNALMDRESFSKVVFVEASLNADNVRVCRHGT